MQFARVPSLWMSTHIVAKFSTNKISKEVRERAAAPRDERVSEGMWKRQRAAARWMGRGKGGGGGGGANVLRNNVDAHLMLH